MKGIRLTQDSDGAVDLDIVDGAMAVGDTTVQEQYLALATHKGEWKEWPLVGIGIDDMAGDEDGGYWKREIVEGMARIGIDVKHVELKNGLLTIN